MKALDYQATIDQPAPREDHATLIQQIWDQIETRPVQETSRDLLDLISREDCDFQSQITAADFSGLVAECAHVDHELALLLLRDMIKLGGGDWEDACYKERCGTSSTGRLIQNQKLTIWFFDVWPP
jgi:hypothetical protein